jgi:hypothetical protein
VSIFAMSGVGSAPVLRPRDFARYSLLTVRGGKNLYAVIGETAKPLPPMRRERERTLPVPFLSRSVSPPDACLSAEFLQETRTFPVG